MTRDCSMAASACFLGTRTPAQKQKDVLPGWWKTKGTPKEQKIERGTKSGEASWRLERSRRVSQLQPAAALPHAPPCCYSDRLGRLDWPSPQHLWAPRTLSSSSASRPRSQRFPASSLTCRPQPSPCGSGPLLPSCIAASHSMLKPNYAPSLSFIPHFFVQPEQTPKSSE